MREQKKGSIRSSSLGPIGRITSVENDLKEKLILEQVVQSIALGVIVVDEDGVVGFVNVQAEKILGLKGEHVVGKSIIDVLPLAGAQVIKCLKTGKPQLGRHIIGKKVSIALSIARIAWQNKTLGAVCSFKGAEEFERSAKEWESYRRQNVELSAIFKSSSDGIWVCDREGRVIDINPSSEKFNGIKAKNVIGRHVSQLIEEGLFDQSVTLEVLEKKLQVTITQYMYSTKKTLLVTGTPVFDEKGEIFMVVLNERDMTQLNNLTKQLEENRKVTEKIKDELTARSLLDIKKEGIIAVSESMQQCLRIGLRLANLKASNILILGESGTGKGILAKFIHQNKQKPFIQINCAALPENLLEAELFGYEKGAFTGAGEHGKVGLFELAQGGTIFLDEIGEMPLSSQAKLLKYLDDHEVIRIGGIKPKKIECTVIAATNRDLEDSVKNKKFRQDLFYRLNTFTIRIPPLRDRPEDIFELSNFFLQKYNSQYGVECRFLPEAYGLLQAYNFPGNVRELNNVIQKVVVMSDKSDVDEQMLKRIERRLAVPQYPLRFNKEDHLKMKDQIVALEKEILENAMAQFKSTREMATRLGLSQATIVRKMQKCGLSKAMIHI